LAGGTAYSGQVVSTPSECERCEVLGNVQAIVGEVMTRLAAQRPVFHAEADFQHALAWMIHEVRPTASIRLEQRMSSDSNERLDLLAVVDGVRLAMELKYPVMRLVATVDGEAFVLRNSFTADRDRAAFVQDIVRVEALVEEGVADAGVALLLSNATPLWDPARTLRGQPADSQFRFHEGATLAGRLAWSGDATWWRKQYPEAFDLLRSYRFSWCDYSNVGGEGGGTFRWTCAVAER